MELDPDLNHYFGVDYRVEHAEMARKLALTGFSDKKIAEVFGVTLDTLMRWQDEYPELRASLFTGRALADSNVAEKLYERALGYSHPAVKFFKMGKPGEDYIETVSYTEHYPPDTQAGQFWLKNRQPEHWRDQTHQALTDAEGRTLVPPTIVIQPVRAREPEPESGNES